MVVVVVEPLVVVLVVVEVVEETVGLVVGDVWVVVVVVVVVVVGHEVMQGQQQYRPAPHEPHTTPYPHPALVNDAHSCGIKQTQPLGQG